MGGGQGAAFEQGGRHIKRSRAGHIAQWACSKAFERLPWVSSVLDEFGVRWGIRWACDGYPKPGYARGTRVSDVDSAFEDVTEHLLTLAELIDVVKTHVNEVPALFCCL